MRLQIHFSRAISMNQRTHLLRAVLFIGWLQSDNNRQCWPLLANVKNCPTCILQENSPIQQGLEKNPTGTVDIPVNFQGTSTTPEHLPLSQPLIHPPTVAAGLTCVYL